MSAMVWIMVFCLILSGCTAFQRTTGGEELRIKTSPDTDIEIVLKDGSSRRFNAHHYLFDDGPGNYVYGRGELTVPATGASSDFLGKLVPVRVDSGHLTRQASWSEQKRVKYYDFWVSDSAYVRMMPGEFIAVNADTVHRLWYVGGGDWDPAVTGNVPAEGISSISVRKPSKAASLSLITGSVILLLIVLNEIAKVSDTF